MQLDSKLEKNFLKFIKKPSRIWSTSEKSNLMQERNNLIHQQFLFTEDAIEKLLLLNKKLQQEEKRIFTIYKKIQNQCEEMVLNKDIDDFEMEIFVACWNEDYYIKFDKELEGNPFFKTSFIDFMKNHQEGTTYDDRDFNYYKERFDIPNMKQCRTFFELWYYVNLTAFDLYNIDEIWMEVRVQYQFFADIKK